MSSTPEVPTPRVSSIPPPEVVAQSIVDLTNETFDRLMPRIIMHGRDPRRRSGESGIGLTTDNQSIMWDDEHGQLVIAICDRESYKATAEAFLGDWHVKDEMKSGFDTHQKFVSEKMVSYVEGAKRYRPIGSIVLLHALRDRYPRGNTGATRSWWAADKEYTDLPPEEWGDRHKVGIEVMTKFEDALAPTRRATWRYGIYVQSRFDKPEPQIEKVSRFDGLVETRDIEYGSFKPVLSRKRRASHVDVERMAQWFRMAKDIRPYVHPAAVVQTEREAWRAMVDDFFHGGKPSGTSEQGEEPVADQ